jgi:serine/threonine protein kinase
MLEKIQGASLLDTIPQINRSALKFYAFVQHCLTLLGELQTKGIRHRDIRPDNILVRNHKPLLIDFGWAISNEHPYFTPLYLGGSERPPDGSFCDIYSMGKVLEKVGQHKYPIYDLVIELMTDPNGALRVTSLDTLKLLFACVAELGI